MSTLYRFDPIYGPLTDLFKATINDSFAMIRYVNLIVYRNGSPQYRGVDVWGDIMFITNQYMANNAADVIVNELTEQPLRQPCHTPGEDFHCRYRSDVLTAAGLSGSPHVRIMKEIGTEGNLVFVPSQYNQDLLDYEYADECCVVIPSSSSSKDIYTVLQKSFEFNQHASS